MELEAINEKISEYNWKIKKIEKKILEIKTKKWKWYWYILNPILILFFLVFGLLILINAETIVFGGITFLVGVVYFVLVIPSQFLNFYIKKQLSKRKQKYNIQVIKLQKLKDKSIIKNNKFLQSSIIKFKSELDIDNDGKIDVIQNENEFMEILKSNQKLILKYEKSENRDFTKQFIKLSNFLIKKESHLQDIFSRISEVNNLNSLSEFKKNIIQQIQFYNVLKLNSLQMISSFVDDDRITFYLIYEKLDKLGVWNTNFENQFLLKMDLMNFNINELISEIRNMSDSINNSLNELIYITEETNNSLSNQLEKIGSNLDTGNMLNIINTYQNYKISKNTKSLKS